MYHTTIRSTARNVTLPPGHMSTKRSWHCGSITSCSRLSGARGRHTRYALLVLGCPGQRRIMLITPVRDPCSSSLSHPRVALIAGHLEQSFSSNPTGHSELSHPLMKRAPGSSVVRTFVPCPMAEPTVRPGQSLVGSVRIRLASWRPFVRVRRVRLDDCTLRQHSARPRGIIVRDERCTGWTHSRLSASGHCAN